MSATKLDNEVNQMVKDLKRERIHGSFPSARAVVELCRTVVAQSRWPNTRDLLTKIKQYGNTLINAAPDEMVIGNMIRRVLFLIREARTHSQQEKDKLEEKELEEKHDLSASMQLRLKRATSRILSVDQPGMFRVLEDQQDDDYHSPSSSAFDHFLDDEVYPPSPLHSAKNEDMGNIKSLILEGINDLIDDIENSYESVSEQAIDHIHANEVIMTFGRSRTVEAFLKEAGRKRNFQLIVAESAPSFNGRETAALLAKEGIDTTLVPDSAIYGIMARVNKVIIGTHSVMANGGLLAQAGSHIVAQAAKYYSVPLMVCTALYKLCPLYPSDHHLRLRSPVEVMNFEEVIGEMANVSVINPAWDYIPPELVSLFITNSGGHNPTYIYRLLAEFYNPKDDDVYSLQDKAQDDLPTTTNTAPTTTSISTPN